MEVRRRAASPAPPPATDALQMAEPRTVGGGARCYDPESDAACGGTSCCKGAASSSGGRCYRWRMVDGVAASSGGRCYHRWGALLPAVASGATSCGGVAASSGGSAASLLPALAVGATCSWRRCCDGWPCGATWS